MSESIYISWPPGGIIDLNYHFPFSSSEMMLATLGPPTKASTPSAWYSKPLFHSGRLCYWMAVKSTDLDKWRMADRAARRGSQLAMSSNGFNTATSNHSSCFVQHCTHICSGDTIGGETLQLPIHADWRFIWPTPHILGQAELVCHEKH